MRRVFSLMFVVAVALVSMPPPVIAQAPDLVGRYAVQGTSAGGQAYHGELEIVVQGTVYYLLWRLPQQNGSVVGVKGVGLVHGGVLAVAFVLPPTLGVGIYPIVEGTITAGTWTAAGDDTVYQEQVKKLPADHPPARAPTPATPAGRLLQG